MKRFAAWGALAVIALLALLLFVDVHAGYTTDQSDSQQTIARGQIGQAPVGEELLVYLSGDRTLARALTAALPAALQAKQLTFLKVRVVDRLPADSNDSPLLSIVLHRDGGVWTPAYATRNVEVTMHYSQGRPVDPGKVLAADLPGQTTAISADTCRGECTEGMRMVNLHVRSAGLISLPYMRSHAAEKVAAEAATLVADGLPEHLNPAKWQSRAFTVAREKLGSESGGLAMTFQRLPGCQGGVMTAWQASAPWPADWRLLYYDAAQDAVTDVVSRSDLQARWPGVTVTDGPAFGSAPDGLFIMLQGGKSLKLPAGTCNLSGWTVSQ